MRASGEVRGEFKALADCICVPDRAHDRRRRHPSLRRGSRQLSQHRRRVRSGFQWHLESSACKISLGGRSDRLAKRPDRASSPLTTSCERPGPIQLHTARLRPGRRSPTAFYQSLRTMRGEKRVCLRGAGGTDNSTRSRARIRYGQVERNPRTGTRPTPRGRTGRSRK